MTALSVQIEQCDTQPTRFRAYSGEHESSGSTMGEALDAFMSDWDGVTRSSWISVQPIYDQDSPSQAQLICKNGLLLIDGGQSMSISVSSVRKILEDTYLERERSFITPTQNESIF